MSEATRTDESYRAHYDAAQFRVDTWNELKQLTAKRERRERAGSDTAALQEEILATLETLMGIEAYFAFPGTRTCRQLESLMKRGLYAAQARQTERVVRLLVGDAYRRRDVSEIFHEDFDTVEASGAEIVEHIGASGSRPYFEVLVVDEVGADQSQETRKRMLGMRRDQDEFVYDVVVVGSFEDAVIAALFNHNIQSVVVRYNFPFESTTRHVALRDYLSLVELRPGARQAGDDARLGAWRDHQAAPTGAQPLPDHGRPAQERHGAHRAARSGASSTTRKTTWSST